MRFVIFCHSLRSDWNHGNAHFLRGVVAQLQALGHDVATYEPRGAWSVQNLLKEHGRAALTGFRKAFPDLEPIVYDPKKLDLGKALKGADVVLVHEWNEPELIKRIGRHRARWGDYVLLFHDTHHRAVTKPEEMARFDLTHYDGVLAFGDAIRKLYLKRGWAERAWTWHEAADTRVFHPIEDERRRGDLVWVGNWGDEERTKELKEFLIRPAKQLKLKTRIHGVRYPPQAKRELRAAGIKYAGWIANHEVPRVFAQHAVTVHVPRRPYVEALPGIPTIRVFEALASGIPLISAPWRDKERLFRPGKDFLVARDGKEMKQHLRDVLADEDLRARLVKSGLQRIRERHTCAHRVEELLAIVAQVRAERAAEPTPRPTPHPTRSATSDRTAAAPPARPVRLAFFGSSLVSSYWNGAATYYRGILKALHRRGIDVTFYEPDAYDRQNRRDIADPDYARVVVYANDEASARKALEDARGADVVVKASGVGVFDEMLEREVLGLRAAGAKVVFWDVDAPATLDRVNNDPQDPFRPLVPQYDLVLTYGGGPPVVKAYEALGARRCVPVFNALDPDTHHPVADDPRFDADLALLANRLPDREARIEEFFLKAAQRLPDRRFLLGGSGWDGKPMPANVRAIGHVGTADHNAFNCTPLAVLNVNRESMARYGFSPPTRVFEAAGAGACLISDAWEGLDLFLEPGKEVLVAKSGDDVAALVEGLTPARARRIGEAGRRRILREHTYDARAEQVVGIFREEGIL